jgi:hypothetical protein
VLQIVTDQETILLFFFNDLDRQDGGAAQDPVAPVSSSRAALGASIGENDSASPERALTLDADRHVRRPARGTAAGEHPIPHR